MWYIASGIILSVIYCDILLMISHCKCIQQSQFRNSPQFRHHLLFPPEHLQRLTIGHTHCSVALYIYIYIHTYIHGRICNYYTGDSVVKQTQWKYSYPIKFAFVSERIGEWVSDWVSEYLGLPRLVMVTVSSGQTNTWLKVAGTVRLFGCYGHQIIMWVGWHKYHQMAEHPCLQQSLVCEWRRRLVWFLWLWIFD